MIKTRNLSYSIGEKKILHDISIELKPGEMVGLMGPNGSGKTTLLQILCGCLRDYQGSASINDMYINRMAQKALSRFIAVVPQEVHFAFPLSCLEVVLMGRFAHQDYFGFDSVSDRTIARAAMERSDCWQFKDRNIQTLSGGERQRVLMARALTQKPRILLLDEPASHLDLKHQESLYRLLHELRTEENLGILCVVHDLNRAHEFNQVILLHQGCMSGQECPDKLLDPIRIQDVFQVRYEVFENKGRRVFVPAL